MTKSYSATGFRRLLIVLVLSCFAAVTRAQMVIPPAGTPGSGTATDPYILPSGTYGTPYNTTLISGISDSGTYELSFYSTPPGLGITNYTQLSGTPNKAGVFSITVGLNIVGSGPFTYFVDTIYPVPLTMTIHDTSNFYGAFTPGPRITYSGFVNSDNASTAFSRAPTITTTPPNIGQAGTYVMTVTNPDAPNYNVTVVNGTLTINPVPLTITPNNIITTYGKAPTLTASYSGLVNDDLPANVFGLQLSTTATADSPVGKYLITAANAFNHNYQISYDSGTLTIQPALLTITAANDTMTYGGTLPPLTLTYTGFVNQDDTSKLTSQPSVTTNATSTSSAGYYQISITGAADSNYNIFYQRGTLTIEKDTLTVTANDTTMPYGGPLPVLTVSYSGFANKDNVDSIGSPPTASTTATKHSPVGTYLITPNGGFSQNYSFNYVSGNLTVKPVLLTITANPDSSIYGSPLVPDASLTVSYSGFVNGDRARNLEHQPVISDTAYAGAPVGTYSLIPSGAVDSNYNIQYDSGSYTITRAKLIIEALNETMDYGSPVPAPVLKYIGFVNGDSADSSLSAGANVSTTATSSSPVGTYPINVFGATSNNYNITFQNGELFIQPVTLTVTAANDTMKYGGVVPPLTVNYSGFVNGDTVSSLTPQASATTTATSDSAVGTYPIIPGGAGSSNYRFNYVSGSLTIGPVPLTVTADNDSMSYGGPVPGLSVSYSGFVNGDSVSNLTTQATATTTATSDSTVGTYPITAAGASDSNYTISYFHGKLTVVPATLTVTASNDTMTFGATVPALPVTYSGFVNDDNASKLTMQAAATTTATSNSAVGTYPITAGGAGDTNYRFVYMGGTLTIDPAALVITADSESKVYGTPDPKLNYTVTGLVDGDDTSMFTGSLTRTPGENVGSYPISQGTLSGGANYVLRFIGSDLTITKAAQQISWTQNLLVGCNDSTQFQLNATASSGLPITYTSSDPGVGIVASDVLTVVQPGTVIITASQPGDSNYLPAGDVADTAIDRSVSLVRQHWANVLFFDNGSGDYTQWQWYNNGMAIPGATGQYYSAPILSGQYYVIATIDSGGQVQSCPLTVAAGGAVAGGIKVFPNPVNRGQVVSIVSNYSTAQLQGAFLQITDVTGKVWQQLPNVQPTLQTTMPAAGGIYIISLQLSNGQKATVNVLVND